MIGSVCECVLEWVCVSMFVGYIIYYDVAMTATEGEDCLPTRVDVSS